MSSPQRLLVAVGVLALLAFVVWVAWPARTPETTATGDAAPTEAGTPRAARTARPGARTKVPRVVRNVAPTAVPTPTPGSATEPSAATPPAPTAATGGPIDRRENPPADAEATRAAIVSRMAEVNDEISACLDGWAALDPGLAGSVSMAFQLDASGLEDAWVVDHSDVPFGPLSCFGSAIGGIDWTGVTSEPLEVTFPFQFDSNPAPATP
ncbi:MAG: hypothetical protein Q8P41_27295 [Pseudomonadota bacterium]|nr:hypothetical protein [Pseudomonadota bacterium]